MRIDSVLVIVVSVAVVKYNDQKQLTEEIIGHSSRGRAHAVRGGIVVGGWSRSPSVLVAFVKLTQARVI